MEQTKYLSSDRVVLWFNIGDSAPTMHLNGVGIFRLMQRRHEKDAVIFEATLPEGYDAYNP